MVNNVWSVGLGQHHLKEGRIQHTVGENPIGRPTILVLEEMDGEWVIYYLDAQKNVLTHSHVDSREDGFLQAQHDFEICPDEWVQGAQP
jgi:hypothetical protein